MRAILEFTLKQFNYQVVRVATRNTQNKLRTMIIFYVVLKSPICILSLYNYDLHPGGQGSRFWNMSLGLLYNSIFISFETTV